MPIPGLIVPMFGGAALTPLTRTFLTSQSVAWVVSTNGITGSINPGAEDPNRWIIFLFSFEFDRTISSVTYNSVSFTKGPEAIATGASPDVLSSIWYGHVPTGTGGLSATVVINSSANGTFGRVDAFSTIGPITLFDSDSQQSSAGLETISNTIDIPAGGIAFGVISKANDANSIAVTGLTERTDVDAGAWRHATGDDAFASAQSAFSVDYNWTGGSSIAAVAASFGPT